MMLHLLGGRLRLGGQSNEEETPIARQVCEDLWRSWQIESWPEQDCRQATTKSNKGLPYVHSEKSPIVCLW